MISGLTEPPTARLLLPVCPTRRHRSHSCSSSANFATSQWHEVLRTKDEAKARDLFEALGARGKLEELKPRLKPLRSRSPLAAAKARNYLFGVP